MGRYFSQLEWVTPKNLKEGCPIGLKIMSYFTTVTEGEWLGWKSQLDTPLNLTTWLKSQGKQQMMKTKLHLTSCNKEGIFKK